MRNDGIVGALEALARPVVMGIRGETEIRWVSDLDASFYGPDSIDYEGLCGWWRAYPKGIHALWRNNRLIGAMGIWPLRKETYDRIVAGDMDETDIRAEDIRAGDNLDPSPYWYLADIVLEAKHHKTRAQLALTLIEKSIKRWLGRGNLAQQVHVCAFGFRKDGVNLLEGFKFTPPGGRASLSPTGKPIFARTMMTGEILEELDRVSRFRKRRPEREAAPAAPGRQFDVFISYRREHFELARMIHEALEEMSYSAYLDVADRRAGRFDEALYKHIRNAPNFVVILSPGCLERCPEGEDYFLGEIAQALAAGRKIIPVKMSKFEFPAAGALPADLQNLPLQQYVTYLPEHPEFADATIEELVEIIESSD